MPSNAPLPGSSGEAELYEKYLAHCRSRGLPDLPQEEFLNKYRRQRAERVAAGFRAFREATCPGGQGPLPWLSAYEAWCGRNGHVAGTAEEFAAAATAVVKARAVAAVREFAEHRRLGLLRAEHFDSTYGAYDAFLAGKGRYRLAPDGFAYVLDIVQHPEVTVSNRCGRCGGKGSVEGACPACAGSGCIYDRNVRRGTAHVRDFSGNDWAMPTYGDSVPCPVCHGQGTGFAQCPACRGSGNVRTTHTRQVDPARLGMPEWRV